MSDSPLPEGSKSKANGLGKVLTTHDIDGHDLPPSPAPSTPRNGRKYALMTELVYTEGTDQYNASSVPIYQVYAVLNTIIMDLRLITSVCNLQADLGHGWQWRI
jgi:hypothetical protein